MYLNEVITDQEDDEAPVNRNLRFLIVDDEGFNLIAMEGILNFKGFGNIKKAFDGIEALTVLRENDFNFDIVFTDFQMPHMNGVEFAQEVRKLQVEGVIKPELQVILASGNNLPDDFCKYPIGNELRELFDLRLRKPFCLKDIAKVLGIE